MIESLAINNFKKFEHIELKNLARVNIFAGINNVGKTSVLEAVLRMHAAGICFHSFRIRFYIDYL